MSIDLLVRLLHSLSVIGLAVGLILTVRLNLLSWRSLQDRIAEIEITPARLQNRNRDGGGQ